MAERALSDEQYIDAIDALIPEAWKLVKHVKDLELQDRQFHMWMNILAKEKGLRKWDY